MSNIYYIIYTSGVIGESKDKEWGIKFTNVSPEYKNQWQKFLYNFFIDEIKEFQIIKFDFKKDYFHCFVMPCKDDYGRNNVFAIILTEKKFLDENISYNLFKNKEKNNIYNEMYKKFLSIKDLILNKKDFSCELESLFELSKSLNYNLEKKVLSKSKASKENNKNSKLSLFIFFISIFIILILTIKFKYNSEKDNISKVSEHKKEDSKPNSEKDNISKVSEHNNKYSKPKDDINKIINKKELKPKDDVKESIIKQGLKPNESDSKPKDDINKIIEKKELKPKDDIKESIIKKDLKHEQDINKTISKNNKEEDFFEIELKNLANSNPILRFLEKYKNLWQNNSLEEKKKISKVFTKKYVKDKELKDLIYFNSKELEQLKENKIYFKDEEINLLEYIKKEAKNKIEEQINSPIENDNKEKLSKIKDIKKILEKCSFKNNLEEYLLKELNNYFTGNYKEKTNQIKIIYENIDNIIKFKQISIYIHEACNREKKPFTLLEFLDDTNDLLIDVLYPNEKDKIKKDKISTSLKFSKSDKDLEYILKEISDFKEVENKINEIKEKYCIKNELKLETDIKDNLEKYLNDVIKKAKEKLNAEEDNKENLEEKDNNQTLGTMQEDMQNN